MPRWRTVLLMPSDDIGWADLRAALGAMHDVRVLGEAIDLDHAGRLAADGGLASRSPQATAVEGLTPSGACIRQQSQQAAVT